MKAQCLPNWVKAILGGKGCVASTYPEAPGWFLEFVERYGGPGPGEKDYPGSGLVAAAKSEKGRNLIAAAAAITALVVLPRILGRGQ